jgi:hypothetical protein
MSGQSKKSSGSSRKRGIPAVVDDANVKEFVELLTKVFEEHRQAHVLDAEMAYSLALGCQKVAQMTPAYAEAFAEKVRTKVDWAVARRSSK